MGQVTYELLDEPRAMGGQAIKCLRCESVSYHPQDVQFKFCARCQIFHEDENLREEFDALRQMVE